MYKHAHESVEKQHNIMNECAKKRSGHIPIKNAKELLKEDPHVIRIDGIHAKETPTIMGEKI
jgi:hypothetical protein